MNPPYDISPEILQRVTSIAHKIGEVNARFLIKSNPKLRKQNQIRTIHSSLSIEGNTLSEAQITAIVENKRVIGPEKDIKEVLNALHVYKKIKQFKQHREDDFLRAHAYLMEGLIERPGQYRKQGVGIVKGSKVTHLAPPPENVPFLMRDLFEYVQKSPEIALIKSCVFHYEVEFIHPFMDGNGRMGRLWQTVMLMQAYPLFEFLPFETLIAENQAAYYDALSQADKTGKSTIFIEFMLGIIDQSLNELVQTSGKKLNGADRMAIFLETSTGAFSRKDYMAHFPEISAATASRDLNEAAASGLILKQGDKNTTIYFKP
jgi:Fic family protein